MLDERAGFHQVPALHIGEVVAERPVETVVRRRIGGGAANPGQAADADDTDLILSGNEGEIRQRGKIRQLLEAKPAVREACRVQERRCDDPLVLGRKELVARDRVGRVIGEAGRHGLIRAVERVAREQRITVADGVIEASLVELFARRLIELVGEDADSLRCAGFAGVCRRKQLQVWHGRGGDRRERSRPRRVVRHERRVGDAEIFLQPFDTGEEEEAVLANRTAGAGAELVPAERRRFGAAIEEVSRIEGAVAKELESGATQAVRPALGHEADHPAHRPSVVGRIGIGDDAEFLNGFDAQRRFRRRNRGGAGVAAHVGAVKQVAVRSKAHAVDVQLRAPVRRSGAVLLGEAVDAGLEQGEIDVVAAVQRQLGNGLLGDDGRHRRAPRVDQGRGAGHRDRLFGTEHAQRQCQPGFLRHGQCQAFDRGRKSLQRCARFVGAGRQTRNREVARGIADDGAGDSGVDIPDNDVDAGKHGLGLILHGAGDRRRRDLCAGAGRGQCQGEEGNDRRWHGGDTVLQSAASGRTGAQHNDRRR